MGKVIYKGYAKKDDLFTGRYIISNPNKLQYKKKELINEKNFILFSYT